MYWSVVRGAVANLWKISREMFPVSRELGAVAYAEAHLMDPVQQAHINELNMAATAATDETRLKELRDLAKSKKDDEDRRESSIMARAQGLFVALALFGFLFTFGANLVGATSKLSHSAIGMCALFYPLPTCANYYNGVQYTKNNRWSRVSNCWVV
jgi:hypothetical protein